MFETFVVSEILNADIQLTDNSDILGTNLYTYCYNNPIGLVDYNGTEPISFSLVMFNDFGIEDISECI